MFLSPTKVLWALQNLLHMKERVPWPRHRGNVSQPSPPCQVVTLTLKPLTAPSTPTTGPLVPGKCTDPTCLRISTPWTSTECWIPVQCLNPFHCFHRKYKQNNNSLESAQIDESNLGPLIHRHYVARIFFSYWRQQWRSVSASLLFICCFSPVVCYSVHVPQAAVSNGLPQHLPAVHHGEHTADNPQRLYHFPADASHPTWHGPSVVATGTARCYPLRSRSSRYGPPPADPLSPATAGRGEAVGGMG